MTDLYCKSWSAIAVSEAMTDQSGRAYKLLVRTRCKLWSCDYCARLNKKYWTWRIVTGVQTVTDAQTQTYFVTLTAPAWARTPETSYKQLSGLWRKLTEFYRKLHRRLGLRVPEYVRVFEAHKTGALHLHAIIVTLLPIAGVYVGDHHRMSKNAAMSYDVTRGGMTRGLWRVRDMCAKWGGGHEIKIEKLPINDAPFVVSYVTKYLTKDNQSVILPRGARRILSSRGIETGDSDDDETQWRVYRTGIGYDESGDELENVDYLHDVNENLEYNAPVSIWSDSFKAWGESLTSGL